MKKFILLLLKNSIRQCFLQCKFFLFPLLKDKSLVFHMKRTTKSQTTTYQLLHKNKTMTPNLYSRSLCQIVVSRAQRQHMNQWMILLPIAIVLTVVPNDAKYHDKLDKLRPVLLISCYNSYKRVDIFILKSLLRLNPVIFSQTSPLQSWF